MATKYLGKREATSDAPAAVEFINSVRTVRDRKKEVYYILSDTVNDTAATIMADSNLPTINTEVDGQRVHKVTPKEVSTVIHPDTQVLAILWEVTVESDSKFDESQTGAGGGGGQTTVEILSQAPVEEWDSIEEEERLSVDPVTGYPFTTVNGEPIVVFRKAVYPLLTVQRIERYPYNPATIHFLSNKVNSKPFRGAPHGWALMLPPKAELFRFQNDLLSKVTYRVKFRTEDIELFGTTINSQGDTIENSEVGPFMVRVLHQGTKHRIKLPDGSLSEPQVWLDKNGNPGTINLDEEGMLKEDVGDPVFIAGRGHREVDFNKLGF